MIDAQIGALDFAFRTSQKPYLDDVRQCLAFKAHHEGDQRGFGSLGTTDKTDVCDGVVDDVLKRSVVLKPLLS
jgi:hypothetical protein